jgi:hypothetical protein
MTTNTSGGPYNDSLNSQIRKDGLPMDKERAEFMEEADSSYCKCCSSCGESGCCGHYCECCEWENPDPGTYKLPCIKKPVTKLEGNEE